jgi:hypothetical protein
LSWEEYQGRALPLGKLTCRFVDYAVAQGLHDAEVNAAVTAATWAVVDAAAQLQASQVGFIPEAGTTQYSTSTSTCHIPQFTFHI